MTLVVVTNTFILRSLLMDLICKSIYIFLTLYAYTYVFLNYLINICDNYVCVLPLIYQILEFNFCFSWSALSCQVDFAMNSPHFSVLFFSLSALKFIAISLLIFLFSLSTEISMQYRHDGACPTTSKLSSWVSSPGLLARSSVPFLMC